MSDDSCWIVSYDPFPGGEIALCIAIAAFVAGLLLGWRIFLVLRDMRRRWGKP